MKFLLALIPLCVVAMGGTTLSLAEEMELPPYEGSPALKTMKSLMEIDFLKNLTLPEKMSLVLAENYHMSGNLDYGNMFLKRVRKISSFDIVRISKKYLRKENMVILNVFSK